MGHEHSVLDTDTRFIINPITRQIVNDTNRKITLIQGDHNSEIFGFEIPRHIEKHDMSLCNLVEVHYFNISTATQEQESGIYTVKDLQVSPEDEEKVIFSWLISNGATTLEGTLHFLVRFKCVENNGTISYAWNTGFYTNMMVSKGSDADVIFEEKYVDIIEQWKANVLQMFEDEFTDFKSNTELELSTDLNRWKANKDEELTTWKNQTETDLEGWKKEEETEIQRLFGDYETHWQNQIEVERARIDQFTKLEEGSTTGDAELIDARIGANGVTYNSTGAAVRGQVQQITNDISEVAYNNTEKSVPLYQTADGWSLTGDGFCVSDETSELIKFAVTEGTLLYIKANKDNDGVMQWQTQPGIGVGGTNPALVGNPHNYAFDGYITVPDTARYLIISRYKTDMDTVVCYAERVNRIREIRELINNSYNSAFHSYNRWEDSAKRYATLFGDSENTEKFLFFTDAHLTEGTEWESEFKEIMGQIQQCYNYTPTTFCLSGGDWLGNSDSVKDARYKLGLIKGNMDAMFGKHYDLVGNHDTNAQGESRLTNNSLKNIWGENYFSFDGKSTKFYCFNTGDETDILTTSDDYGWEMCKWFANELLSETSEHIALAMHIFYISIASNTVHAITSIIFKIAKAYNDRTITDVKDELFDFTNATGKIEFAIAGHNHADALTSHNGIPVIITTDVKTDTTHGATFDLVYVDYDNSTLNLVRVGFGEDRTVKLA